MPALRKRDRRHRRLPLLHRLLQLWRLAQVHRAERQREEGVVAEADVAGLQGLELPLVPLEREHHPPVRASEEAAGHQRP